MSETFQIPVFRETAPLYRIGEVQAQPMTAPTSQIFHMEFSYINGKKQWPYTYRNVLEQLEFNFGE